MYLARLLLKDGPAEAADWRPVGSSLPLLGQTQSGSPRAAVALARRTAQAYPQSTRAKQMLMVALTAAGKGEQAIAVGRPLHALDPSDPLTTHLLATALRGAGRSKEAKLCAREADRLCEADPAARQGLATDIEWLHGGRAAAPPGGAPRPTR
jgi:Flp pilus assembly protein TadD